jgi:hypothetical protein
MTTLREINWAGPCIPLGPVVRESDDWWFLDNGCRKWRKKKTSRLLHTEPCNRCMDHPKTDYPNGYDA